MHEGSTQGAGTAKRGELRENEDPGESIFIGGFMEFTRKRCKGILFVCLNVTRS